LDQRHQQQVITYLIEKTASSNPLGGRRLRLTIPAAAASPLGHPLGRKRLKEVATIAHHDTLMRCNTAFIAQKFRSGDAPQTLGHVCGEEIEQLVGPHG